MRCNYALDGIPSGKCPECGLRFDASDPQSYRRVLENPVRFIRLPIAEASMAHAVLEDNGVKAFVEQEAGGIIGYMDLPQASIWIDASQRQMAEQILASLPKRHVELSPWTCVECNEAIEPQFEACWNCGSGRRSFE